MLRKVIKQGHNTLTITIPSKWAQEYNLSAGDEIDLSERDCGLYITTEKKLGETEKLEIDITELSIRSIWKNLMAAYREGFDEIKIKFDPNKMYNSPYRFFTTHELDSKYNKQPIKLTPFETIQEITNRFVGFEVLEHNNNNCVIKEMSEPSSKEFDNSLRRMFLLIQQMAEEMTEAIKTDNPEILKHTHEIDINIDKFHDYCIRILNKTGIKNTKETNILFSTIYFQELIGDEFKNIAYHLIGEMGGKSLKNLIKVGEMSSDRVNSFYNLFYNFDRKKISEILNSDIDKHIYLEEFYKKKSEANKTELEIFNHLRRISRYIDALIELRIQMEF